MTHFSPREIVSELDRFIVGQHSAKRAVAIALRNRWRRQQLQGALRQLEAMMIVADAQTGLVISGNGDVVEPESDIAAIGSGGPFALAAARALNDFDLSAEEMVRRSLTIAGEICVYTNTTLTIETLKSAKA